MTLIHASPTSTSLWIACRSAIHWDIVKILRKEFGGGEIYFDDILIMKDGKFILEELKELNAENLK